MCFYLANFKKNCPLAPTFAALESAICKTKFVLIRKILKFITEFSVLKNRPHYVIP